MGTYLSTPITEKQQEEGEAMECPAAPLVWGVVDMQGWRKSMEDAHVAQTNVAVPPHLQTDQDHDAKVFGVFDGHGGSEVARFTQLYLVDVLQKQPTWVKEPSAEEETVASPVGQALVDAFHALDRMIDQPERRDELVRLRAEKPAVGEQRVVTDDLPIPPEKIHHSPVDVVTLGDSLLTTTTADEHRTDEIVEKEEKEQSSSIEMNEISSSTEQRDNVDGVVVDTGEKKEETVATPVEDATSKTTGAETKPAAVHTEEKDEAKGEDSNETTAEATYEEKVNATDGIVIDDAASTCEAETMQDNVASKTVDDEPKPSTEEAPPVKEKGGNDDKMANGVSESLNAVGNTGKEEDDDSNAAVGKEDAAKLDQDLMLEDSDSEKEEEEAEATNRKVTVMFQKLLNLGGNSGQMSVRIADKAAADQSGSDSTGSSSQGGIVPTIIQNGRQICNLPDHPIHAGCTAIVAVLIGRKLTVANAGDSRAVLCRAGGRAEALSFDHKPQQDRELTRINNAGGFVNQFGRVNGNLNLSRSIGDLKYKQVQGIAPASQMITAEPDIVEVYLQSNDEFVILGCDGIWDCLTNNQAVKYVRERIDTMSPVEIGVQMLDEIISDDPRATQGIGGDNMTVMIIDLQPSKRAYRNRQKPNDESTTDE